MVPCWSIWPSAVLIWKFSDPHFIFGLWVVRLFKLLGTAIRLRCFTVFLLSIADDESVGGLLQLCSKFKNRLLYACTGLMGTAWTAYEDMCPSEELAVADFPEAGQSFVVVIDKT